MISMQTNETGTIESGQENTDEDETANLLNSNNIPSTSNNINNTKPSSDDKNAKIEDDDNKSDSIQTTDQYNNDATNIKPELTKSTTPQSASSSNSTSSCSRQSNNIRTTMGKFKEKRPEPLKLGNPEPLDLSIKSAGNVPSGTHIFNLSSASSKLTTLETPRIVWQENEALLSNKARLFSSSTGGPCQRLCLSSLAGDLPPITPSTPFLDMIYSPTIVRSAGLLPRCSTTSLFSSHGDSASSLQALLLQKYQQHQTRQQIVAEDSFSNKTLSSPPSSNGNSTNKHRLPGVLLGSGNGGQKGNTNIMRAAAVAAAAAAAAMEVSAPSTPRRSCSTEGLSGLFGGHHTFHHHHQRFLQHQYSTQTKNGTPKSGISMNSARFSYNSNSTSVSVAAAATTTTNKSPTNKHQSTVDQFNNGQQTTGSGIGNNGQALTPTSVANATANLLNIHLNSPKGSQQQLIQHQDNSISATQVMLNDLLEGNCVSATSAGIKTCSMNTNDQNALDPLISAAYCQQHQSNGRISFSSSSSTYSTLQGLHDNHHHHQQPNQDNNSKLSQSSIGSVGCGLTNHHMSSFLHHQQTTPTSLTSNGSTSLSSSTTLNTPTLISPSQLKTGSICFLPSPTLSPMSSVFELPSPLLMFPPPSMNNSNNTSLSASAQCSESCSKNSAGNGSANITNQVTTITSPTNNTTSDGSKLIITPSFTSGFKIMSDPALSSSISPAVTTTGAASTTTTTTTIAAPLTKTTTTTTNRPNEQAQPFQSHLNHERTTTNQLAQFPISSSGLTNNYASCSGSVAALTSKLTGSEATLSTNLEVKQMLQQEKGCTALSEGNLAHLVTPAKEKVGLNVLGDDDDDDDDDEDSDEDDDDDNLNETEIQMETECGGLGYEEDESNEIRVKYGGQDVGNRLESNKQLLSDGGRLPSVGPSASTIPKILVSDCLRHHHHHQQQQHQQQCFNPEWQSQGNLNDKSQQHASDSVFELEYQLSGDVGQNQDPGQPHQQREQRNSVAKRALSPQSFRARVRLYHNERLASSSAPPDVYQGRAKPKIKSAINDSCTNLWSTENLCPSVAPIVDQYARCASVLPNQQSVQNYQQPPSTQHVHPVAIQPNLHQSAGASGSNHHLHYKPYPETRHCLGFQQATPLQYQQYHHQQQQQPQPQQQPQQQQPTQHLHLQQQQQFRENHHQHQQVQQGSSITAGYLSTTERPCTGSSTILVNRSNSAEPTRSQQLSLASAHLNQDQLRSQEQLANQFSNQHQLQPQQHEQQQQQQSQHFGANFNGDQVQSQHLASLASYPFSSNSAQHLHANFSTSTSTSPNNNLLKPLKTNSNNNNNQQQLQHLNTSNLGNNNTTNHQQHHHHHHHHQQQQQQQHYMSQQQFTSAGNLHRLPMTSCLSEASGNVFTGSNQMLAPQLNQISCSNTHLNKISAVVAASCLSATQANGNQNRDHLQQRLPIQQRQQQQQQQHLPLATSELDNMRHKSGLEVLGRNPSSFAPNHSSQAQGHASQSRLLLSNVAATVATNNNVDHSLCQATQHEHLQQQQQQHQHLRNRQQRHLDRTICIDNARNPSLLVSDTANRTSSSSALVTGATTTITATTTTTSGSTVPSATTIVTATSVLLADSHSSSSCNSTDIINSSSSNNNNNFGPVSTAHFRSRSAQPLQTNSSGAVKKYRCDQCLKAFTRSDMLTRHKRLHSGDKPFMCNECRQEFSRSDHLSTHMRTHTGEKPYKCKLCAYSACRKDMITRHMKVHNRSSPNTLESGGTASR